MAELLLHQVTGLRELEAALKDLREQAGVKTGGVIIRGLRAGAKLIQKEARRRVTRVPSGYGPDFIVRGRGKRQRTIKATKFSLAGLLRSNIVEHAIPTSSRVAGGKPTVVVRVRNSGYTRVNGRIRFNRPGSTPGWWWWVEFGTAKMPAQPFLRPAFESQKVPALDAFRAHVRSEIEDLWVKHGFRRAA